MFNLLSKFSQRNRLYKSSDIVLDQFCGYATCDLHGKVLSHNTIFSSWFDQRNIFDQIKFKDSFRQIQWRQILNGEKVQEDFEVPGMQGQYLCVTFFPIRGSKGEINHVVLLVKDCSEEKQTLMHSQATKQALDQSYAFIKFDNAGRIIEANDVFIKTMGYTTFNELVGKHHSIFVRDEYVKTADYENFWKELQKGELQKGTFERVKKDG